MDKHDQLEELLVDWEQNRRQGKELTLEEICEDTPELNPELSKLIRDFKATDWLEEDDDSDDDFLHSTVSNRADETRLPKCKLSLDEFCQRLIDSELMDEETVEGLRQRISADDARSFAHQLISDKKLTRFQATVLLEGRDIPLVLDRYILLGEIGKGGMGAVYKALHQQMDRVVALKILPKEAVDSPEKVKRFQREVKAAAKLEHPNIVTTHDATEANGTHFLVMSLVSGSDLSHTVRKQGPVSCAKAVDYIAQAARGLEHAHSMGIIHRDIKPANLLLNKKGKVKILDMGLARIDGGDPEHDHIVSMELTAAGAVMGTVAYLPPEQALDTRTADARSDIYSLGCTLYYLLMGKSIYSEDTMMKTIMAHREGAIPSLCDQREGVPAELDTVFQKMVAKTPADRFQSMSEVTAALEALDIKDDEGTQPVVAGAQAYHDTATFIDTSRDVIEPQPSTHGSSSGSGKSKLLLLAAAAAFILLAGIVYRIQTNKGTITVELADESIAAKLTTSGVIIEDGDREWTINIGELKPLPAGETYSARLPKDSGLMLTVTDDSGTELELGKFQIRRNGKILVKVTASREVVAQTDKSPPSVHNWPKDRPSPAIAPFTVEEAKQHQEAWAKHLGVPVEMVNSIGMKFRVIPPGEFLMGSSQEEIVKLMEEAKVQGAAAWSVKLMPNEGPQHNVTLTKPFALGIHEVTRGQFRQFVEAKGYKTDAEKDGKGGNGYKDGQWVQAPQFRWNTNLGFETKQTDDHPVVNVSWYDAVAFCDWLSEQEGVTYKLPTEAEWEFACRAGKRGLYSFGDDESKLADNAWYANQGGLNTKSVGQKVPNPLGLFDLHGNVWEWCDDGFGPYYAAHAIDPAGRYNATYRVLRGGAFFYPAVVVRSAFRLAHNPEYRNAKYGFRCVRTFEKHEPKKPEAEGPAVGSKPNEDFETDGEKILESEKKTDDE